jgi:hypothetical protein
MDWGAATTNLVRWPHYHTSSSAKIGTDGIYFTLWMMTAWQCLILDIWFVWCVVAGCSIHGKNETCIWVSSWNKTYWWPCTKFHSNGFLLFKWGIARQFLPTNVHIMHYGDPKSHNVHPWAKVAVWLSQLVFHIFSWSQSASTLSKLFHDHISMQ